MAAGQGHARQRAGVAVVGRARCGERARRPRRSSTSCGRRGGVVDPVLRDRLARLYCEAEVLRLNRLRSLSAKLQGRTPGAEASIQKIMADEHGQHVMSLAKDLAGIDGVLTGSGPAGEIPAHMRSGATEIRFRRGVGEPVSGRRSDLALRLPVLTGAHARRRHVRGAAQHRRRTGARTPARTRCGTRDGVDRDPHETQLRARKAKLRAT